jgi:protein SCO1/2
VRFLLVVDRDRSLARRVVKTGDGEIPPPKEKLRLGDAVADFELRDQAGRTVRLSDFRGKVVAINFVYTRCPLPDVCPRLSAGFASMQKRFADRMGRDLILLTLTVDPEHDTPAVLADYAKRWGADYRGWRFLTGEVASAAAQLGEVYWADEGTIGHNSVTSIVGRDGRLAAALDGSEWRVDQLASLIAHELEGVR